MEMTWDFLLFKVIIVNITAQIFEDKSFSLVLELTSQHIGIWLFLTVVTDALGLSPFHKLAHLIGHEKMRV